MLGLAGAALGYYATRVEPYRLRRRAETIWHQGLPPALDGLTILHLSDLHADLDDRQLGEMLAEAADDSADLVAITGDILKGPEDAAGTIELLGRARGRLGRFVVMGNNDYLDRDGPRPQLTRALREALAGAGLRELRNEGLLVRDGEGTFWLAGVDDPHTWRDDLRRALAGRLAGAFTILLAHTPDILPAARLAGVDLVLCGHTHGGQVRLPLVGAPITHTYLPVTRPSGLWREGSTWVNLSGGLGFLRRLRFGARPEVVRLTLRRAERAKPSS